MSFEKSRTKDSFARMPLRLPDSDESVGMDDEAYLTQLRRFLTDLRSGNPLVLEETQAATVLVSSDAVFLALSHRNATLHDAKCVTRLPDLVANASSGTEDHASWIKLLVRTVSLCFNGNENEDGKIPAVDVVAEIVYGLCLFNSGEESILDDFFKALKDSTENPLLRIDTIILGMPESKQETVLKPIVSRLKSGQEALDLLGPKLPSKCRQCFEKFLFSRRSVSDQRLSTLISYLEKCSNDDLLFDYLNKSLILWADPVIARAYVMHEVIHFTKTTLLLFLVLKRESAIGFKHKVLESVFNGLPNHFNSSDGRTVVLAEFLSSMIMETYHVYERNDHTPAEEFVDRLNKDELVKKVIVSVLSYDGSDSWWFRKHMKANPSKVDTQINQQAVIQESDNVIDSDDDDDLAPIESNDTPDKRKIRYLRNFLEDFHDLKSYGEVNSALCAISPLIRNQLSYDHPQVGKDLIQMMFVWVNEYEDPGLDEKRKLMLQSVLETEPRGNLEYFCHLFHQEHVQSFQKNMIFEVLNRVSQNLSLKDLQHMAKVTFASLLSSPDAIDKQDIIVRIPMMLFFSRLLCLMPDVMVTGDLVASYLSAVSSLKSVDSSTQQTVRYALHQVINALGDKKMSLPEVRSSIQMTRNWLLSLSD